MSHWKIWMWNSFTQNTSIHSFLAWHLCCFVENFCWIFWSKTDGEESLLSVRRFPETRSQISDARYSNVNNLLTLGLFLTKLAASDTLQSFLGWPLPLLHSVTKTLIALNPEPGLKNPRWWCLVAATSCVLLPDSRGQACKNKDWARSEEKSSHEFHVEAAFDHLEGVRSYEPCDAADRIWILLSTFPNLPPLFF